MEISTTSGDFATGDCGGRTPAPVGGWFVRSGQPDQGTDSQVGAQDQADVGDELVDVTS